VDTPGAVTIHDYLPGIGDLLAVARAWPRVFAKVPDDSQPIAFEQGRVVVLCIGPAPLELVGANAEQIVRLLNRLLDGDVLVESIDPIEATRAELYLHRDLLALKAWLLDYDVGI
jgi:hypothetical protein